MKKGDPYFSLRMVNKVFSAYFHEDGVLWVELLKDPPKKGDLVLSWVDGEAKVINSDGVSGWAKVIAQSPELNYDTYYVQVPKSLSVTPEEFFYRVHKDPDHFFAKTVIDAFPEIVKLMTDYKATTMVTELVVDMELITDLPPEPVYIPRTTMVLKRKYLKLLNS